MNIDAHRTYLHGWMRLMRSRRLQRCLWNESAVSMRLLSIPFAFTVAASCAAGGPPAAGPPPAAGYAVRTTLPLAVGPGRMDGRLELLEDVRIRPEMRSAIAEAFGFDPCSGQRPAVLAPLCGGSDRRALRPALLRLVDAHGRVIASHAAERPLAELSVTRLYGTYRRTYLFTVDLSAGIGSYSGPYTRLAEPESVGFGWLIADSAGVARDTITLVSTLKTAWRAVPRADGRGQDLLMLLCRPDLDTPDTTARFVLTFKRYTFDGQQWLLRQQQAQGFWESDDDFPPPTSFP